MIKYLINKKPPRFYKSGGMIRVYREGGVQNKYDFSGLKTGGRKYNVDNLNYIADRLSNLNLKQKCAILATIIQESGGDPFAINGSFKGLIQWGTDRIGNNYSRSYSPTQALDLQIKLINDTINNTTDRKSWNSGGSANGYSSKRTAYKVFSDPNATLEQINHALVNGFVRPGQREKEARERYAIAQQLYDIMSAYEQPALPTDEEVKQQLNKDYSNYIFNPSEYTSDKTLKELRNDPTTAPTDQTLAYRFGGLIRFLKGGGKQKKITTGGRYADGTYYKFVSEMFPALYKEWRKRGVDDAQARNLATWGTQQAAHESSYGRSNLADRYNYGGLSGGTVDNWQSFNDIDDYARGYVNTLETNFKHCRNAKNLYEFTYGLQGYDKQYCGGESVQQYLNNLKGVQRRTLDNLNKYLQTNPAIFQPTQTTPTDEEIKKQLNISYDNSFFNADGTIKVPQNQFLEYVGVKQFNPNDPFRLSK